MDNNFIKYESARFPQASSDEEQNTKNNFITYSRISNYLDNDTKTDFPTIKEINDKTQFTPDFSVFDQTTDPSNFNNSLYSTYYEDRSQYNRPSKSYKIDYSKSLEQLFKENRIKAVITSDYRPGAKVYGKNVYSNHSKKDEYGNPMAYDIKPTNGTSFEELRIQLATNPVIRQYLLSRNWGVLDESNPNYPGSTGAHFHVGPDSGAQRDYKSWLNKYKVKAQQGTKLLNPMLDPRIYDTESFQDTLPTAKKYVTYLVSKGMPMEEACAILGNVFHESKHNPNITNHLGFSGLFQMSPSQKNFVVKNYGNFSADSQLNYIFDWTRRNKRLGPNLYMSDRYQRLANGNKDVNNLTKIFFNTYERGGDFMKNAGSERLGAANEYYKRFKNLFTPNKYNFNKENVYQSTGAIPTQPVGVPIPNLLK